MPSITIGMKCDTPELRVDSDGTCRLLLCGDDDYVELELSPTAVQVLGLQCVVHIPALAQQFSLDGFEDAYRLPARYLRDLDERSMEKVIRELERDSDSTVLIDFLWYMKDAALIRKVLKSTYKYLAREMMASLNATWRGKNPDTVPVEDARRGRSAVLAVLSIVRRLMDEGSISREFGVMK